MNIIIHIRFIHKSYCKQKKFMSRVICMFYERRTQEWIIIETHLSDLFIVHT
jgi:hypothetical protein